jgi:hypothetical protein
MLNSGVSNVKNPMNFNGLNVPLLVGMRLASLPAPAWAVAKKL